MINEYVHTMIFNGIEIQALKSKVGSNTYFSRKSKTEFKLYYVSIRISGNDSYGSWSSFNETNAFLLGITVEEYEKAIVKYDGQECVEPCKISFFETEVATQNFIDEYIDPLLMIMKLKYIDKKTINM